MHGGALKFDDYYISLQEKFDKSPEPIIWLAGLGWL